MSANILYITSNAARIEAFEKICADENYGLTVAAAAKGDALANFDLIFCDARFVTDISNTPATVPVVAVYNAADADEMHAALNSTALDILAFPFEPIETASRLRCLSRLHMLQNELTGNKSIAPDETGLPSVLVIGDSVTGDDLEMALTGAFKVECVADDIAGLLRAGQGNWSCVVLALDHVSRDAATLIRQMRKIENARTTPVLVHAINADERCIAALQAGANDMVLAGCSTKELMKRVCALVMRKSVLDRIRAGAALVTPVGTFDYVTGLPGPSQLMRSLTTSLDRLNAQGKPASLLMIAVDAPAGVPEGEDIPDSVMVSLTQVLRRSLRGFDYACRYSANSFAILMPGADAKNAELAAKRLCAEIKAEKVRVNNTRKEGTTASIGLATMAGSSGPASAADLIATATNALVDAQALGAANVAVQEIKRAA